MRGCATAWRHARWTSAIRRIAEGIKAHLDRMLGVINCAVVGYSPFLPVKLVVFPEFAHAAPVYETARELLDKLGPILAQIGIPEDSQEVRLLNEILSTSQPDLELLCKLSRLLYAQRKFWAT